MSILTPHLDHIRYCCEEINNLSFEPPGIFTNALLSVKDITALIRDTEPHERALFSVPPPPPSSSTTITGLGTSNSHGDLTIRAHPGRQTIFNVSAGEVTTGSIPMTTAGSTTTSTSTSSRAQRRHNAVAAVLGAQLHQQIVRQRGDGVGGRDIDMEMLLRAAEKLCAVYALPGALQQIPTLRRQYAQVLATQTYYEAKVAEQTKTLEQMRKTRGGWGNEEEGEDDKQQGGEEQGGKAKEGAGKEEERDDPTLWTEEDLRREEEEVREMERKKLELQERLRMMEQDLAGL